MTYWAYEMGIQLWFTNGYDSRANGLVERFIRTLELFLRKTVADMAEWDQRIPYTLFTHTAHSN